MEYIPIHEWLKIMGYKCKQIFQSNETFKFILMNSASLFSPVKDSHSYPRSQSDAKKAIFFQ